MKRWDRNCIVSPRRLPAQTLVGSWGPGLSAVGKIPRPLTLWSFEQPADTTRAAMVEEEDIGTGGKKESGMTGGEPKKVGWN